MDHDAMSDDSHYEISLTAGQAFTAFVLLLLSLAAAFAFGFVVGTGRAGQKAGATDTPVIVDEAFSERAVPEIEAPDQRVETTTVPAEQAPSALEPRIEERAPVPEPVAPEPRVVEASTEPVPHVAQILSTRDGSAAEALAARLIEDGFTTAYVERVRTENGLTYRVRVTYPTEAAARAAVATLQPYTTAEIWVTKK